MRRIGMLTSGRDCQALNATMKGMVKSLYNMFDDVEIIEFGDGYEGLMYADYQVMRSSDFSGILTQGGTILRTSRQPFKFMRTPDENRLDKVEAMKHTYKELEFSCLVVLGGNGGRKTANMLNEEGLNVVSLPKTTDSDLWDTDVTFGLQSTVDVATSTIDCIHTTATSHRRVFIVEVMGHKAGWLTLYAGLAGEADTILFPEVPYDISIVYNALTRRSKAGKRFSILAVAEGTISREDTKVSKKELKEKKKSGVVYPSVAHEIGAKIQKVIGSEIRITIPGHMQHGDESCACDHILAARLGVAAARLIAEERYGYMVTVKNNNTTQVPLSKTTGRLKIMDPECSIVKETKVVGISFDDG